MPGQRSLLFLDQLRASQLLEPAQLDQVSNYPEAQDTNPRKLARRLFDAGWLTRYQINQVAQGKASDLVIGSYIVLEPIGEGGMGQVFKARHQHMNRVVALKVIRKERLNNPEAVRRFYKEVQAAAQLAHPNIVLAFDAGQTGQTHYFAMEYIDGIDLARLVKESGPLPVAKACDYIRQAALGLQHAHERGLVHRDIKPHNLLVMVGGGASASRSGSKGKDVVKVLDMGLARLQGPADNETAVTKDGVVIGTPDFLAPEQATNARSADIRADLYSLGCTFYYLLTGQPPFQGASLTEVLLQHQLNQARPVQELRPDVPPTVAAIIARLIAKNPGERFQTPAELADALAPHCQGTKGAVAVAAPVAAAPSAPPSGFGWETLGGEQASQTPMPSFGGSQTEPVDEAADAGPAGSRRKRVDDRQAATRRRMLFGVGAAFHVLAVAAVIVWVAWPRTKEAEPEPRSPVAVVTKPRTSKPEPKPQPPEPARPQPGDSSPLALVTELAGSPRLLASQFEFGVQSVLFTPDGSRVLVGDGAGNIRLVHAVSGQEIRRFGGKELTRIMGLAVSAGGNRFLSGSLDRSLRFWDTDTGKELLRIVKDREVYSESVALSPDGRYALNSGLQGKTRAWDTATGAEVPERQLIHPAKVTALAYSADGRYVVSGDARGKVWLWDAATGKEAAHFEGHTGSISQVALSRQGALALSFSAADHTLRGWDVSGQRELWQLPVEGKGVAFAADGGYALGVGKDQSLRLWDMHTGQEVRSFSLDRNRMQRLWAVSPNGRSFVSDGQNALWLWSFRQPSSSGGDETLPADVAQKGIRQAIFSPEGGRLFAWGMDNQLRHWNLTDRKFHFHFQGPPDAVQAVFLPDRRQSLTAGGHRLSLWDLETGQELRRYEDRPDGGNASFVHLAVSPDGRHALTSNADQLVTLWDIQTGQIGRRMRLTDATVSSLAFSPDSQKALVGCTDSTLRVWDLVSDAKTKVVIPDRGEVYCLAYTPDGSRVISANGDRRLHLWDPSTWTKVRQFEGHTGPVRALAFSPDGRLILSGSDDRTVRVWDRATGRQLRLINTYSARVTTVGFSPDGRRVLSGSVDGKISIQTLPSSITAPRPTPAPTTPEGSRPPVVKLPVPDPAKQEEAARVIRDLYKDGFAKKSNADKLALAQKLIDTADKTPDQPVEKFVLLREARDLAAQGGDLKLALKVINHLAGGYLIDDLEMKTDVVGKVAETATTVATARPVLEQYFALAEQAQARDDFDGAARLLSQADAVAHKANNTVLIGQVEAHAKSARELKDGFDAVKAQAEALKTRPNDPDASLAMGKFYCLVGGNWKKGLPLLAAGNDAGFKAAAQKELANPDQAAAQVEVGNAWWDLAAKADGPLKLPLQRRAYYWYEISEPGLTGLTKTQTEARMKELDATAGFKTPETVGLVRVFEGHTDAVRCVALSRDGRSAFSCGNDGGLRQWSVRTGREVRRLDGQGESVGLALSLDGQKAAVGTTTGTITVYDVKSGQSRQVRFGGGNSPAEALVFLPNGRQLVYTSSGRTLVIQDVEQEGSSSTSQFDSTWGAIKCLALAPNGRVLVFGCEEGTVHARDLELQKSAIFAGRHVRPVLGVAFSPDGNYVLSAGADGNVALWNAKGAVVRNFKHPGRVTSVAFSPDGSRFATGNADKTVRLWDVKTAREIMVFDGHQGEVTSVAFAPDGMHVLSGSTDKTLRWWRLRR